MAEVGLSDFIESLRNELQVAIQTGANQDLQFTTQKVDLEVQTVLETTTDAKGKVSFKVWVLNGEASAGVKSAARATQRVSLSLAPYYKGKPPGEFQISETTSSDSVGP